MATAVEPKEIFLEYAHRLCWSQEYFLEMLLEFVGGDHDFGDDAKAFLASRVKDTFPEHIAAELALWKENSDKIGFLIRYGIYCELFGGFIGQHYKSVCDIGCGPMPFINWMSTDEKIVVDPLARLYSEMNHWAGFWLSDDVYMYEYIYDLPALGIHCALMFNLIDHIPLGAREAYFKTLYDKLAPGCIIMIFTHLRAARDSFHFPVSHAEMDALANRWFKKKGDGVVGQKMGYWPQESWWGVYQKGK